jgi:hypothetical protein
LDDLLVLLPANKFATRQVKLLTTILSCFGLTINVKKSRLTPATQFTHLGLGVDLRTRQFVAPREKVIKLRSAAMQLAQFCAKHKRYCNKKSLASFVGLAISLSPAIPAARFKLLALYDSINSNPSWNSKVMVRLTNCGYRSLKYFWSTL